MVLPFANLFNGKYTKNVMDMQERNKYMALLHVNFHSETLGMNTSMDVILPQIYSWQKEVPLHQTLYLFGGGGCDHTYYQRNYPIEKWVENYNLAVIMPSVITRYKYSDSRYGMKWWTFCSEELPRVCQNMFYLSKEREDTFAAGSSGGGHAALKLGLCRPDLVGAVAGIHPASLCQRFVDEMGDSERGKELRMIFGDKIPLEDDMFELLEAASKKEYKAAMYICCGTEDGLFKLNVDFRDRAA
jgi:S-formylglutathione hydrolase FrmB